MDLQYIDKGSEMMYWTLADELAVSEDYRLEKDILFYKKEKVKKIVFKIKCKN